jgi:hypothetical protein
VDWRTSKVKNCEPVANQARADVCSTAVSTYFGTIAGIVTGFLGAGGVSVPEPGAVVMFGVGVVLLRLFTGYAGASIEAHANASDPPMGVTGSIRLREHRCAPSWSLRETLAAGAMLFPLRSGFIGSDVSSQGVDKAYNRAIFRWPGSQ